MFSVNNNIKINKYINIKYSTWPVISKGPLVGHTVCLAVGAKVVSAIPHVAEIFSATFILKNTKLEICLAYQKVLL